MKTVGTILSAAFVLMPWIIEPLFSQQNAPASGEKKITITKRSIDADGSETTEIIVKRGKAAEDFDVDKYVNENRGDKIQLDVQVEEGGGDDKKIIVRRSPGKGQAFEYSDDFNFDHDAPSCDDKKAFLGVEEDSDEDDNQPGLVVEVVRGSAADKAGLRDNDMILKLNDQKTDRWSDLTKFMSNAKPGDAVKIAYSRNGKEASVEVTLTTRSEVKSEEKTAKGFLGVSDKSDNEEEEEEGVSVSITKNSGAEKAGLRDGDLILKINDTEIRDFEDISDFMEYTSPGEKVNITYEREGKRNTTEATLGEQKSWDWNNWNLGNLNLDDADIKIREKEACLGVYTEEGAEDENRGAQVTNFTTESAAREAQMQEGDLITSVNGQRVQDHDDLWNEIAKYKVGDKVNVEYLRDDKPVTVEATLKACRDNSGRVQLWDTDKDGDNRSRNFFIWNWSDDERRQLRERRIITIRRGAEGDSPKVNTAPENQAIAQDRSLKLESFRVYPNPTQGQVTVEFKGEPVATIVSLFDMGGRQIFREELNAFSGDYNQQFDLTEYAKGTIIVHILQGDKVFTDQIVVN